MPREVKGADRDSGCNEQLSLKGTPESALGNSEPPTRNAGENKALLHYISDKKIIIIIVAIIVIVVLSIVIILLAVPVKKTETYLPCPLIASQSVTCPDFWIGYRGKCFYTSKEEKNWSLSLITCSSFNASLAVIDSQNELGFWVNILGPFHYWFGLSREIKQVWKWSNGTEFKNQFPVGGDGFCAYVNGKGADSTICSMEKHFLCSRPESCGKIG